MPTFPGEIASLELMGRQKVNPQQYAEIVAPFWINVLFGVASEEANPAWSSSPSG